MLRSIAVALVLLAPSLAAADPNEPFIVGGWFGPRLFSKHSVLGYIDSAPAHPMLNNSIELGGRISRNFIVPWLFPELELAIVPTSTTAVGGAASASVFWLEPRVAIRFELRPGERLAPFVSFGGGAPIALSSARKTFNSGVIGEGFIGAGVRLDTHKGFMMRLDARFDVLPGVDPPTGNAKTAFEGDVLIGIEFALGKHAGSTTERLSAKDAPDRDGDGIPDAVDKCPDRPEDMDGFEDADGCPDIDNDLDRVLDIADKCPMQPETYNGFEDEDGCPDTVPPEVQAMVGTVEGLLYGEGETAVRESAKPALKKIAAILAAHPSIKIVLTGHTDDREAKAFATPPVEGQPPPDLEQLSMDLSHGRAEAVRQALVAAGVGQGRIVVEGVGAEDPVADNAKPRGRLANRRVGLKLFVAQH